MDGTQVKVTDGAGETLFAGTADDMRAATAKIEGRTTAQSMVRAFVERFERLEEEKKEVAEQQKEVLAEAKAQGFDTKAIREIIRLRRMGRDQRDELAALVELYADAMGDFGATPLGAFLKGARQ